MSQIITVTFAQGQYEAVADQPLAQWAYGQKLKFVGLELPASYAVDFSNWEFQGDSIQRIGNADGVAVPTEILTSGRNVYAFIWITDANSGRRRYMAMARVIPGPGPAPEEPNPQESSEISEVLAELNAAVETAEDAASRGPQIRDGYWYTWSAESQEYENTEVPSSGNKIWWTTSHVDLIPGGVRYMVLLPYLNGPAGASPAVSDLVVGPAPNTSGSATYLYYIFYVDIANQQVILKSIGSIKGAQGDPGDDGVSPSVSVSEITGGHQVSVTDAQGTETFDVMNGQAGPAGPSGGQFWTAQSASTSPDYTWSFSNLIGPDDETPAVGDIIFYSIYRYTVASVDLQNQKVTCTARTSLRGQQGQPGQGVPASGDQAQVLSKKSATDYDTQWSDIIDLLSSTFKAALLQLAAKVAYIDDQGPDYYQDLYDALYPPKELVSISAVFTQGQTVVYDTDSLDNLKSMLVVTGTYDDQSTETIPSTGYTLSGTLTAGTSTITVTCDGKTTSFTVQVTHQPGVYAVTNNLTGCSNSNSANSVTEGGSYSGTITASAGYMMTGATVNITMGGVDITSTAYSNGTIYIASVTGALVITVTAVAVTLSSISAVYTQSGVVYTHDDLDSLKTDLVVTALYSDSTSEVLDADDYTLSGTLTAGTSTITVAYSGKTTTFTVTVTAGVPSTYQMYDSIMFTKLMSTNYAKAAWIELKKYDNLNAVSVEFAVKPGSEGTAPALLGRRSASGSESSFGFYAKGGTIGWHLHGSTPGGSQNEPVAAVGEVSIVHYTNTSASPSSINTNNNTPISVVWTNSNVLNLAPVMFGNPINDGNTNLANSDNVKVGYIKFFNLSGDLISHYFPVVRKSDSVIGMYDAIGQVFYTPSTATYATIGNSNCIYSVENWS